MTWLKYHGLVTAAILSLMIGTVRNAEAQPIFSPDLKNVIALDEAAAATLFLTTIPFGFSVGEQLPFSGTFTESGWSLTMGGTYLSMPVNLSFNGSFNPSSNTGAFSSAGTIGVFPWTGSGSWSFTDVNPQTVSLDWSSQAIIGGQPGKPDFESSPKVITVREEGGFLVFEGTGLFRQTEDGRTVGVPHLQTTTARIPITAPPRVGSILFNLDSQIILTGAVNLDTRTVSGSLQTVPEPSTLLLLASGLSGIHLGRKALHKKGHSRV